MPRGDIEKSSRKEDPFAPFFSQQQGEERRGYGERYFVHPCTVFTSFPNFLTVKNWQFNFSQHLTLPVSMYKSHLYQRLVLL